ncbi:MAG: GNAT family N-acetyltransferase [Patescibacteria group bacterium]|jgi:FemAB-related protein (PEP-CTERM system-associated)
MAIKELTKDQEQAWENFLNNCEESNFSHSLRMRKIIRDNYGFADNYLVSTNDRGLIVGILPLFKINKKKSVSLPFTDSAGFIGNESALSEFADYLMRQTAKDSKEYELRQAEARNFSQASLSTDNISSMIDLKEDSDNLWKRIDKKARNQVRKAEKYNPEYLRQKELLADFYLLYLKSMKRHGTPAHKVTFFANIMEQFDGIICAVKYNNQTVAAALTFIHKNILHIPWAASDRKFKSLNFNDYLYWRMISESCDRGLDGVDLGRSQVDSPVAKFKNQWDCRDTVLQYYLISSKRKNNKAPQKSGLRYLAKIYRLLPLNITALIGPRLRKYLP